jgi:hypothetical protein
MKVSVLYVQEKSIYKTLGMDCWDEERDARLFPGGNPVVAHPPCRLWSRMRGLSTAPASEKTLALLAIDQVRKNGGVLEHPASSTLWPTWLPLPGKGVDHYGGYSISVNQHWWGHKAEKKTFLYIVGVSMAELPPVPLSLNCVEYTVGSSGKGHRKEVSKHERSATPLEFARFLIEIAGRVKI